MNPNSFEKIGSRIRAWKQSYAEVGAVCGRIHELVPRYDAIQAALTAATDDAQIKTQLAAMVVALNDSEQAFRELELAASVAKIASRDAASQIKKLTK